jgi:hypothetical protein
MKTFLDPTERHADNSRRSSRESLISGLMFRGHVYLRAASLWAMIPLTVFAGRPATGCTCANGEYKLYCAAHLMCGSLASRSDDNELGCGKSCCRHTHRNGNSQCCHQGTCCHSDGKTAPSGKKCCNPDMLTAISASQSVQVSLDIDSQLFFDLPVIDLGTALPEMPIERVRAQDTGPPGGDLVITLCRLLV